MSWFIWIIILGVLLGLFFSWLEKIESKNKSKDLEENFESLQDNLEKLKKELAKEKYKDLDTANIEKLQTEANVVSKKYKKDYIDNNSLVETKTSKLLKEATQYKKTDIKKAIALVEEVLLQSLEEPVGNKIDAIKKLAYYTFLSNNFENSIKTLHKYYKESLNSNSYFTRIMNAYQIVSYMGTIYKKDKRNHEHLDILAEHLHILAMACQGRFQEWQNSLRTNEIYLNSPLLKQFHNEYSLNFLLLNKVGKIYYEDYKSFEEIWISDDSVIDSYNENINFIDSKLDMYLEKI